MRKFTIDDVTLEAKSYRTAVRRYRGYQRGELTLEGKTILLIKRDTIAGRAARKAASK